MKWVLLGISLTACVAMPKPKKPDERYVVPVNQTIPEELQQKDKAGEESAKAGASRERR